MSDVHIKKKHITTYGNGDTFILTDQGTNGITKLCLSAQIVWNVSFYLPSNDSFQFLYKSISKNTIKI